jgi:hypothetical protein
MNVVAFHLKGCVRNENGGFVHRILHIVVLDGEMFRGSDRSRPPL